MLLSQTISILPWSNQINRDLEAAASEIDPQKRAELFWDFQRHVVADLPAIDLIVPQQLTIYDKRVINHTIGADGINANWADLWLDR